MDETFKNAPLLEIIAELRWQTSLPAIQPAQQQDQTVPPLLLGSIQIDNFLHRLGGEIYKLGFQRMERLIPAGSPVLQGQAVCRYRSDAENLTNVLYQVGAGLLSAHATPPYRSWKHFRPSVEHGIEVLLQTREQNERDVPFNLISLRYLDGFRSDLTQGREVGEFLSDVLKITLTLPDALLKYLRGGKSPKPFLILTVPSEHGALRISTGEAVVNGASTILLDMTFSTLEPIAPELGKILESFDRAHSVLHDIFIDITEPIHHLMRLEQ